MKTETHLRDYLKENWDKHFPAYDLLGFEYPIIGCISGKEIGRADIAFNCGKTTYLVEIKLKSGNHDFWSALKVIGYAKSMNLTYFKKSGDFGFYHPLIMVQRDLIRQDILQVLKQLKCGHLAFGIQDGKVDFDKGLNPRFRNFEY